MPRTITIEIPDDTPPSSLYALASIIYTAANELQTASGRTASIRSDRDKKRRLATGEISHKFIESFREFATSVSTQINGQATS